MSILNTVKFITNHPLNEKKKLKSVIDFAKWQIGSRLLPGEIVFDWVNGSRFFVKGGETGLTGNVYTGLHEFPDMGFLLHLLRPEDLFVDVGANVGSYTILACSAIGSQGIAFEPVPNSFDRLMANIRLNHLDEKVKSINKGVGAQLGTMAFTGDQDTMNHAVAPGEQTTGQIEVEVTTLNVALKDYSPVLIKIDVEGYESPVLEGADEILSKSTLQAVIMELNGSGIRYGFDESEILALMLLHGFQTYSYDPFKRELISLNGKNLDSGNTLFIRDDSFVKNRLENAPAVHVGGVTF